MGRSFKHWTPLYIISRIRSYIYYKKNNDKPWLTQNAIKYLNSFLINKHEVLEFGSGRSTFYFAEKCRGITTFESDSVWFNSLQKGIKAKNISNIISYYYEDEMYYKEILNLNDNYYDVILIDGIFRPECTEYSLQKLKNGGLLIIDNANWYFPNNSLSPDSKRSFNNTDNEDLKWMKVYGIIKMWQQYWTTNNVTDTLLLIKP